MVPLSQGTKGIFTAFRVKAARFSATVAKSRRKRGILGTVRVALRYGSHLLRSRYREWRFDRRLGVHTRGTEGFANRERILQGIQSDSKDGVTGFGPTDPAIIADVLGSLDIRHEDYVFVDVGSGKGRVILIASDWPFKRVVGVELSRELHEKALENIRNRRGSAPKCGGIETVSGDATQFPLPNGPVCLFLHNPFRLEQVMEKFLSNVERCWRESPRPIWVLYLNPILDSVFEKFPLFERVPAPRHYCSLHRAPASAADARSPTARDSQNQLT
jgi:hypothetical protein